MRLLPLPEYESFDALDLASHMRDGRLTPLEALDAAIARVNAHSHINSVALRHDEQAHEAALQLSRMGQAERSSAADKAPLLGVP
ncbi:MAG: Amidase, partial [Variovorax sp.]|nr:Amidase [Variovorax sp.]